MGIVEGKVAIVTGAGRGVGRGEAMELAAQGAKVVCNDLGGSSSGEGADTSPVDETVKIILERGGEAVANYDDVSSWDGSKAIVEQAREAFGALDIVVNNAGILRDTSIVKMSEQDWDKVIAVHLKGTFNMTHHACEYWSDESKAGRVRKAAIVNTVSSAGLQGNRGQANYGAAKAGIAALTVITALEGERYGVRANAVAPGGATRIVHETMPDIPLREANEVHDDEFERLNPGNSAPMVVWLASDEASLVTGQVFRAVGADISAYEGWRIGATASNAVKGEPQKWDPARLTSALGKDVFGTRPGGLKMSSKG
ncbi:MAG: SDR family oxidoreductase [Actinomycetia bacterium]|nr:SDR family oxidoreductase [Actinomycetes bacterium]